jgi:hypothetical protein
MDTQCRQQPISNERADDADYEVTDEAVAAAPHDLASQPAGDNADQDDDDETFARLRWRIAGLGEIVGAGLRGDFVEALADAVPESRHGSLGGLSQVRFELSEGHLDRIQIGEITGLRNYGDYGLR